MSHAFDSKALALSRQVMGLIETPMHEAQLQAKIQNLFIDAMKFAAPAVQAEQLSGNSPVIPDGWLAEAERLAELHGASFVIFRHGQAPVCADPSKFWFGYDPAAPKQEAE